MSKKRQYALYKCDEYIFGGTKEEIAKYLGVKLNTISFYSKPAYLKNLCPAIVPKLKNSLITTYPSVTTANTK